MVKLLADPERGKKISSATKRNLQDPKFYAEHCARTRRGAITKRNNPELRERQARIMREVIQPLSMLPENLAKRDHARTGRLASAARLAWCPEELRDEYRRLCKSKRMKKAEAKEIILAHHKAMMDALSPFERQMRALENGAKLVANDDQPSTFGKRKWA